MAQFTITIGRQNPDADRLWHERRIERRTCHAPPELVIRRVHPAFTERKLGPASGYKVFQ